ncbi:hypothetical protein Cyast_2830 [Cyanobacterium stanieri PCC 7202]|uniref:Uncharacterized protein n=1 Tax=Cyanobacterium stanieri (strain ATCC 29140 / PCC 7202) TaxID=292563 RepID=K9YPA1_CYASC|nr:hypothetical protein Cyast_2830 [Cyanobacterium stanieri PCC 7202]
MLRLIVPLTNLKNRDPQQGFTLVEIVAILVIIGIGSAIATPSLINSRRQDQVNQAQSRIRSALVEAQINANRLSTSCEVTIGDTDPDNPTSSERLVTATPSGCLSESIRYDSDVVDVTQTSITYNFQGRTGNAQTIIVGRKNFNGTVIAETEKCIVVSSVGMIRTGIGDSADNCSNPENARYDLSVN